MTTPEVHEIRSARRDTYAQQHATNLAFTHGPAMAAAYIDAYRSRCAEIRELDRRADAARSEV
jgi:hypothetical protein